MESASQIIDTIIAMVRTDFSTWEVEFVRHEDWNFRFIIRKIEAPEHKRVIYLYLKDQSDWTLNKEKYLKLMYHQIGETTSLRNED